MPRRVLNVGQCQMDQSGIARFLRSQFEVDIETADTADETLVALRASQYDLVLVNRKLDSDYSDGMDIIRQMKADPSLAGVPVMLVSNYAEAQQAAVDAGAAPGFGKSEYGAPQAVERLKPFLEP